MWNMQLCMAHLLVVSGCWYLQKSASSGAKTSFSDQEWPNVDSRLLSFEDIEHWRPPNDAPCNAANLTYQAVSFLMNIVGLDRANLLAKTGTEPAGSGLSWIWYGRNGPKMEPLLTLGKNLVTRSLHRDNDCEWRVNEFWFTILNGLRVALRQWFICEGMRAFSTQTVHDIYVSP